ncbi:DNA-binding transcriptional regulator [Verrucomicrobiaceae bacterium N1E253]|uniref:DNA-binding transcriptional regulator n=1 Tax=Oceaniferula marina TaxID=2748318 RepID=A0A851GJA1_9BACT|nr:DNA-binding transcriptional regulator [Oceaniferula marina]NWK55265.1 DNA-binding transcriptional regulator [Oceaniferula marina]
MKIKKIAVSVESSRAFGRGLIQGICDFAAKRDDWQLFYHESTLQMKLADWVDQHNWDGIITRITHKQDAQLLSGRGIPTVDLLGEIKHPRISTIDVDHQAVSKMALGFFLQAGFHQIAYCGYSGIYFSDKRLKAFQKEAEKHGLTVHNYSHQLSQTSSIIEREAWRENRELDLTAWIKSLPKPIAIFACNDVRALDVSSACRINNIKVPEDVIILGVDNDPLICQMGVPSISSISPNLDKHGYEGAHTLQQLIDQRSSVPLHQKIPPIQIIERPSTDLIAFNKEHVANAVRYMRKHYGQSIATEQIAEEVGVSRSLLDRDFKNELGRTVSQELTRIRLGQIKYLLQHTSLTITQIATETGFMNDSTLSSFFKTQTKLSPGKFRQISPETS